MGSLVRKKTSGILLTVVATILLIGLLSPAVSAGVALEQQKIRMLESLGLKGTDPAVVRAAREACTLYAVDIVPGDRDNSVVLRLSGPTTYKSYSSDGGTRFVVDLQNTINLAPAPVSSPDKNVSIKQVRNSQYKVSPTLVSRIVVELTGTATPEIKAAGDDLMICMAASAPVSSAKDEVSEEPAQKEAPSKVVSVPAVKVNTESPKVDYMLAKAVALLKEPEAEASSVEQPPVAAAEPDNSEPAQIAAAALPEPAAEAVAIAEPTAPPQGADAPEQVAAPSASEADVAAAEPAPSEPAASPAAEQEQPSETPLEEAIQVKPQAEPEPSPLASRIAVKPAPKAESPDGNLVSLNFRDADLGAVLDILARKGNFNILAGRDVRGTVTVRLNDVPLDVALNAILNVNGYGFVKMNNIIRIVPLSQLGKEVVTTTETYLLSYATAKKAKETLTGFLTPNGSIQTDERTNLLIITDTPGNMDRIRMLVPQIDRRVEQVLIEVLILDSVLSDETDLGVQWTLFDRNANTLVHEVESTISSGQSGSRVNLPVTADALNVSFAALMGDFKLDAFIQAAVDNTESRVLANPKILTVNNESAHIEIIEEFPYSDVTQTSQGGQLSNITFKEIGTKLEVKPQISHDGHVILRIKPEQNSVGDVTTTGVPIVNTRRAETTLIVKDHQTVVLGGLRQDRKVKSIVKVPLLGDLPGVKYIFRSITSDDSNSELLVFLTVHIVESPPLTAEQKLKFEELGNLPRSTSTAIDIVR